MSDAAWPARLSPHAAKALADLPDHAREMLRDVLDIAARDPWSFPAWDSRDPEGEDVRSASVGQFSTVYWINRPAQRLYVIDHHLAGLTVPGISRKDARVRRARRRRRGRKATTLPPGRAATARIRCPNTRSHRKPRR